MQEDLLHVLESCGVIREGHFAFTSGWHSDHYIEKRALYEYAVQTADVCLQLALRAGDIYNDLSAPEIEVVVGPAAGGIILSNRVAEYLTECYQREVISLFTEKDAYGNQVFSAEYVNKVKGKNVLIVDDVVTTGGTLRQLIEYVRDLGGNVLGAVVICLRTEGMQEIAGVRLDALLCLPFPDWPQEQCLLCSRGVPLSPR